MNPALNTQQNNIIKVAAVDFIPAWGDLGEILTV